MTGQLLLTSENTEGISRRSKKSQHGTAARSRTSSRNTGSGSGSGFAERMDDADGNMKKRISRKNRQRVQGTSARRGSPGSGSGNFIEARDDYMSSSESDMEPTITPRLERKRTPKHPHRGRSRGKTRAQPHSRKKDPVDDQSFSSVHSEDASLQSDDCDEYERKMKHRSSRARKDHVGDSSESDETLSSISHQHNKKGLTLNRHDRRRNANTKKRSSYQSREAQEADWKYSGDEMSLSDESEDLSGKVGSKRDDPPMSESDVSSMSITIDFDKVKYSDLKSKHSQRKLSLKKNRKKALRESPKNSEFELDQDTITGTILLLKNQLEEELLGSMSPDEVKTLISLMKQRQLQINSTGQQQPEQQTDPADFRNMSREDLVKLIEQMESGVGQNAPPPSFSNGRGYGQQVPASPTGSRQFNNPGFGIHNPSSPPVRPGPINDRIFNQPISPTSDRPYGNTSYGHQTSSLPPAGMNPRPNTAYQEHGGTYGRDGMHNQDRSMPYNQHALSYSNTQQGKPYEQDQRNLSRPNNGRLANGGKKKNPLGKKSMFNDKMFGDEPSSFVSCMCGLGLCDKK